MEKFIDEEAAAHLYAASAMTAAALAGAEIAEGGWGFHRREFGRKAAAGPVVWGFTAELLDGREVTGRSVRVTFTWDGEVLDVAVGDRSFAAASLFSNGATTAVRVATDKDHRGVSGSSELVTVHLGLVSPVLDAHFRVQQQVLSRA